MIVVSIIVSLLFALFTALASIVSVPASLLDKSGELYSRVSRSWAKGFEWFYFLRVKVTGLENIPNDRAIIFIANHTSYTDVPVVIASIPRAIRLMMRDTLTRIPIWGWSMKVSPFLIVSRDNAAKAKKTLDHAIKVIHDGATVLLFPEGTRSANGVMQEFKRGAFRIAIESGATVVPIAIKGTYEVLPRSRKFPAMGTRITVRIGEPIHYDKGIQGRAAEVDLMKRSEEAMRELLLS
jgi:1-acyl-sn-glycerol-3-phosphate acyltransferase